MTDNENKIIELIGDVKSLIFFGDFDEILDEIQEKIEDTENETN